jgi:low affinity Fe/Cu permease
MGEGRAMKQPRAFSRLARVTAEALGHPWAFAAAVLVVVAWGAAGPVFGFSDTWQLTINTGTTIVTFLMVFLIQNTQNHQGDAIQLKLDELIRAIEGAHNMLVDLEDASDDELRMLKERYKRLRMKAQLRAARGGADTGSPEVLAAAQRLEPEASRTSPGAAWERERTEKAPADRRKSRARD